MISLRFTELAAVVNGTLNNTLRGEVVFKGVTIDSRSAREGQLFIAIRGEKQDGHKYIDQAITLGASGIISANNYHLLNHLPGNIPVVSVENTHQAMLELATEYRRNLSAKIIAVTGSNGKTTTKEFIYQLLTKIDPHTYRSPGNLNNLYGVPLAIFGIDEDTECAVLELGISTNNEMPTLAKIVQPDIVLITNVGPSHLEFLKTIDEVAEAKLTLIKNADPSVPLIINGDDEVVTKQAKKIRDNYITFGLETTNDFHPESIEYDENGNTIIKIDGHMFELSLKGNHQVYNLTAAYAVTKTLGFNFDQIDTRSIKFESAPLRGEQISYNNINFIVDCYNANPASVKAGLLSFLIDNPVSDKIIILGDMLELGVSSEMYHREIGRLLAGYNFKHAVLVGQQSKYIFDEAVNAGISKDKLSYFKTINEAQTATPEIIKPGDSVYLKGSRGIGLENILKPFEAEEKR